MFKNFQLPIQKGQELFPDVIQAGVVVRLQVMVEVEDENSNLDIAELTAWGEYLAQKREGEIVGFLLGQRQNALMSGLKIHKRMLRFDHQLTVTYTRLYDYEYLDILITVSEEEGIEDLEGEELCMMVLYQGNRIAAISQKDMRSWNVRYRKKLRYSFGTDVMPMSEYRFSSRRYPCVFYGAFYLQAGTNRIVRSDHYWFSRTSFEHPFHEFYESKVRWDYKYIRKYEYNSIAGSYDIEAGDLVVKELTHLPIMNGRDGIVYTPSESFTYTGKQIEIGDFKGPDYNTYSSYAISADGWYYLSFGIAEVMTNSADTDAAVASLQGYLTYEATRQLWDEQIPNAYGRYKFWSRYKGGAIELTRDYFTAVWEPSTGFQGYIKNTINLDMPISVISQSDGVDHLDMKGAPFVMTAFKGATQIVQQWAWYGYILSDNAEQDMFNFFASGYSTVDPDIIEAIEKSGYKAGDYYDVQLASVSGEKISFLGFETTLVSDPNYFEGTDPSGQTAIYRGYTKGNAALINYVAFPPSLSAKQSYATQYKWDYADTYGGTYPTADRTMRASKTPWGMYQNNSATAAHLVGWLHASNGYHMVQGAIVNDRHEIYIDNEDATGRLSKHLGCSPKDVQAIVLDIPLSAIKRIQ